MSYTCLQALAQNLSLHRHEILDVPGGETRNIHKRKGVFLGDVLLPTPADCDVPSSPDLNSKDFIMRTEYEDRRRDTCITIFPTWTLI